ncbi:hypothetical protein B0H16DRAFT_1711547 [Mycena metata]|uniref:Uncharacterized protein n=1 Tax=Mycena metata TaxID=1033252 RepID=A0AAD7K8R7_9AGAR|nr:hypothetical protein B0H16DRAFT_1711547 [Mycena metata]
MISVETFNATVPLVASSLGVPEFQNLSTANLTQQFMTTLPVDFSPWISYPNESVVPTLGLFNNSLYTVVDKTLENGQAIVPATGLNISCGYVPATFIDVNIAGGAVDISVGDNVYSIDVRATPDLMVPDTIWDLDLDDSITLYTSNTVLDSEGNPGLPVIFSALPPSTLKKIEGLQSNVTQIQFLKCTHSLVPQSGQIDTEFNTLNGASLHPNIYKNSSRWISSTNLDFDAPGSTLLGSNLWKNMLNSASSGSYLNE